MEINLLALNVGNSRLSMGAFVAGEIGEVTRIPHAQRDQWAAHIGPQWDRIKLRDNAAIVAAGVNPPMQQALADAVEQATGRRVVWVGRDLDLPIKVLTEKPEEFDPRQYLAPARTAMQAVVAERMRQFGQAGHAGDYEPLSLEQMRERYAAGAHA